LLLLGPTSESRSSVCVWLVGLAGEMHRDHTSAR
jgi:hypothetical protein